MAQYTQSFRPVGATARYSTTTVSSVGSITDSSLTSYLGLKQSNANPQATALFYNFASLPNLPDGTVVNKFEFGKFDGTQTTGFGFSASTSYTKNVWVYSVMKFTEGSTSAYVEDTWAQDGTTTRLFQGKTYNSSAANPTKPNYNNGVIDLIPLLSNVSITGADLKRERQSGQSIIAISLGHNAGRANYYVYVNDAPVQITYTIPDDTYSWKNWDGTVLKTQTIERGNESSLVNPSNPTRPDSGGYRYTFSGWSKSGFVYTATYTATQLKVTYKFCDKDGNVLKTAAVDPNTSVTPPASSTVARSGYEFVGWIPSDNGILCDSYEYTGVSADAHIISRNYMYTDKISIHIEAKSTDWQEFKSKVLQIISCAESGGWDLGADATFGGSNPGFEIYDNGKTSGSHYRGVGLSFTSLSNEDWHTFDCVYDGDKITVWLDGISKGSSDSFTDKTLKYHASNAIFVGGEAGSSATSPNGKYFKGLISNVFIENTSERLVVRNGSFSLDKSRTFYPVYRILQDEAKPVFHSVQIVPNPVDANQGFIIAVSVS